MRNPASLLLFIVLLILPILLEGIGVARLIPILTFAFIMSIYALSFSLLLGYLGLLNFGHAVFFGLGAYITAYQLMWLGISYLLAIIVSASIGSLVGVAIAFITKKASRGVPFAFITLTLLLIVYFLYRRRELRAISGSEQGLIIQLPEVFTSTMIPIISILAFSIMLIRAFNRGFTGLSHLKSIDSFLPRRERAFPRSSLLLACIICIIYVLALVFLISAIASRPGPFRISINVYIVSLTILYLIYILLIYIIKGIIIYASRFSLDSRKRQRSKSRDYGVQLIRIEGNSSIYIRSNRGNFRGFIHIIFTSGKPRHCLQPSHLCVWTCI